MSEVAAGSACYDVLTVRSLQKLELQSVTRPDDHSRVDPFDHKHIIPATPPRILGVCKAMRTEKRRGGGAAIPDPDILETPVDHSRYLRVFATLLVAASGAGIMGTWAPNGTCSTSGFGSLQPGVKVNTTPSQRETWNGSLTA